MPSTEATPMEPPKRKAGRPKKISLPPPGEAFQEEEPKSSSRSRAKSTMLGPKKPGVTKPSKAKPMTTLQKIAADKVARDSKNAENVRGGSVPAGKGAEPAAKRGRPPRGTVPGMLSVLESHGATMNSYSSSSSVPRKRKADSVLMRPTERTKSLKKKHEAEAPKAESPSCEKSPEEADCKIDGDQTNETFKLMELPENVRERIWRYAVVHPSFFIWPDTKTGKEQPDLAMVCRQIRREALPIYYKDNSFAVEIPVPRPPREPRLGQGQQSIKGFLNAQKKAAEIPEEFKRIGRWARALEKKSESFGKIQKWCFSYTPPVQKREDGTPLLNGHDDGSLVVSVHFKERGEGFWGGGVEVHREARCVLPGFAEFGICKLSNCPDWLNGLVIGIMDAAKGRAICGDDILELMVQIQKRVHELTGVRCEEVRRSIESDSGVGGI